MHGKETPFACETSKLEQEPANNERKRETHRKQKNETLLIKQVAKWKSSIPITKSFNIFIPSCLESYIGQTELLQFAHSNASYSMYIWQPQKYFTHTHTNSQRENEKAHAIQRIDTIFSLSVFHMFAHSNFLTSSKVKFLWRKQIKNWIAQQTTTNQNKKRRIVKWNVRIKWKLQLDPMTTMSKMLAFVTIWIRLKINCNE